MSPSPSIRSRRSRKVRSVASPRRSRIPISRGQADPQQPTAGGVGSAPGVSTPIMKTFNANQMFFDLPQSMASGGLHNESILHNRPLPGIQYFQCRAIPAVQLRSERYLYRQRRGTLPVGPKTGSTTLVGYAQQQDIANGKARSAERHQRRQNRL